MTASFQNAAQPDALPALPARLQLVKTTAPVVLDESGNTNKDKDFEYMLSAYRASGGLVNGEQFEQMLKGRHRGDFMNLARIMVSGEIFSFEWNNTVWIPMFQFEPLDLHIRRGPRAVLATLEKVFDNWTLALWFVQPNSWLDDRLPIDVMSSDISGVLHAAREDRFIARG